MRISSKFVFVPEGFMYPKHQPLNVEYEATKEEIEQLEVFVGDGQCRFEIYELLDPALQVKIAERIWEDREGVYTELVEERR